MNCTELFFKQAKERPETIALFDFKGNKTTFKDLSRMSFLAQNELRKEGMKPGDTILLQEFPGPRLYSLVIGILSLGATAILVEPWMPIQNIEKVINEVKPKLFFSGFIGKLWGLRVKGVRNIDRWIGPSLFKKPIPSKDHFILEDVEDNIPGIITFTTGTTGDPKGVVRNQGYLVHQHRILSKVLEIDKHKGTDLCVFANFVFLNLASGRPSLIMPMKWTEKNFKKLDELPDELRPETVTSGPSYLMHLIKYAKLPNLKGGHIGGALTDIWIFEEAIKKWPKAEWTHVYGSSEAEPVGVVDLKEAVLKSKEKGYFQTLCLGKPVSDISVQNEKDALWVSGDHVCPRYIGNEEENRKNKRKDENGKIWHNMGDRIKQDNSVMWYSGRSGQPQEEFDLEQKVYQFLKSSLSFVTNHPKEKRLILVGEKLKGKEDQIKKEFPSISEIVHGKIIRDIRHRSRINRVESLRKCGL